MFAKYIEKVVRWRFLVILLTVLATVFMVSQMRHLKVIVDPNQMLPQKHPYVIGTNFAEKVFGSNYVLVVGVSPKHGDIYQPAVLERVRAISEGLARLPNVKPETLMSVAAKRAKGITGAEDGLEVKPMLHGSPINAESMEKRSMRNRSPSSRPRSSATRCTPAWSSRKSATWRPFPSRWKRARRASLRPWKRPTS